MSIPSSRPDVSPGPLPPIAEIIPAALACVTTEGRITAANRVFIEWFGEDPAGRAVHDVLGPAAGAAVDHLAAAPADQSRTIEVRVPAHGGERHVRVTCVPAGAGGVLFLEDISQRVALEEQLRELAASSATLARVSQALTREFDLQQLVQTITDGATELAGAQFGALFYNVRSDAGESYTLYTISGVPREKFSRFPMPRNTKIFDPTFRGAGVVRFDDVTRRPEYGQNPPYRGMPEGHLPVRSYLAVPVKSATGEVLGGLFFGHERPGVFTERTESALAALASQAGVAIDNSRLVQALRRERSQAEEAGRLSRFVSDIVPQLLWTADPSGAVDYFNARWVEYTGLDSSAASGSGWGAALHPDDLQRTVKAWNDAVAAGSTYEATVRLRRASDGHYRWFLNRAQPLRDDAGGIVRWFGSCTDIHLQKQHEDAERLLSEASRVLASSLDLDATLATVASLIAAWFEGYCIIDVLDEGRLQRVAAAHVDPAKQPVLDELRAYAPGEDYTNPLWRVLDGATTVICNDITESQLREAVQSPRHAELRAQLETSGYLITPLRARREKFGTIMVGAIRGRPFEPDHVGPLEELAYRVAIAIANARAYRAAREANRLKDEFLAVVSHELRTPLNAMRGWAALLKSHRLTPAQQEQALDVIERNINAQAQLVDDLLDISRIVSGKMRLTVVEANLAGIVAAAIESVALAAAAKGITITQDVDARTGILPGDPDRLQQVVWNLLSNAIKFTGRGGRVLVTLRGCDQQVELSVADTGQGIPAEFLPHVFDRFRQGDGTTTRLVGGLGLGLAIVRHLVEQHGGTVSASSAGEGLGATFVVMLPRRGGSAAPV